MTRNDVDELYDLVVPKEMIEEMRKKHFLRYIKLLEYKRTPEARKYQKEYYQRPEVRERKMEYGKEYNQRPEVKEKRRLRYEKLKNKIGDV